MLAGPSPIKAYADTKRECVCVSVIVRMCVYMSFLLENISALITFCICCRYSFVVVVGAASPFFLLFLLQ